MTIFWRNQHWISFILTSKILSPTVPCYLWQKFYMDLWNNVITDLSRFTLAMLSASVKKCLKVYNFLKWIKVTLMDIYSNRVCICLSVCVCVCCPVLLRCTKSLGSALQSELVTEITLALAMADAASPACRRELFMHKWFITSPEQTHFLQITCPAARTQARMS